MLCCIHFVTKTILEVHLDIKYNKKKQELRSDPVLEFIEDARKFIVDNSNLVILVISLVLLASVGWYSYGYMKESGRQKASEAYGHAMIALKSGNSVAAQEALSLVVDKYKYTIQAEYSAYLLGKISLDKGDIATAEDWFNVASKNRNKSFVSVQAFEGLASCAEINGDINSAIRYLTTALRIKEGANRFSIIRWKLALLNRKSGNIGKAINFCEDIIADSTAITYKQDAKNLLAELRVL